MYVRLVRPQPRPGQAEEYARRWKEILAPRARDLPGFHAAYFVGDITANAVTAIFLWDDEPGEALDRAMDDFRHQCRDITSGPATREDFVILAEA
jgi:heme-degrading monooxygenase HmoA